MKYVYLMQSISYPDQRYIGVTSDLKQRLAEYNAGKFRHSPQAAERGKFARHPKIKATRSEAGPSLKGKRAGDKAHG